MPRDPEKTVLITGAARRIGAAIARSLAAEGWAVAVHYHRSAEEAEALADEFAGRIEIVWKSYLLRPAPRGARDPERFPGAFFTADTKESDVAID